MLDITLIEKMQPFTRFQTIMLQVIVSAIGFGLLLAVSWTYFNISETFLNFPESYNRPITIELLVYKNLFFGTSWRPSQSYIPDKLLIGRHRRLWKMLIYPPKGGLG